MSEVIANQSEESPIEIERDADTEALFDSFGLAPQKSDKKDIEFPKMEEPTEPLTTEEDEEEVQEETPEPPDKRTIKVKYLGEDKDVPEDEAPTWIQKGMNHDRLQKKLDEQQKALDEVAQLQGFKNHEDLMVNLPKLKEQQQQKEQNEYNQLREDLRQEFIDNGLDPDKAEAWLDNHPLIKKAQVEIQQSEERTKQEQEAKIKQEWDGKWQALYQKYPDLAEDAKNGTFAFYTDEIRSRVERGYDPIDAYELVNRDKLTAQTKKATEQKIIRQQQLGVRGQVNSNTATPPDEASLLPVQMSLAEEFGVSVKGVQRQNQLLKTRR